MSTLEAQDTTHAEPLKLTKVQYLKKHWVMVIAFIIVLASILWVLKLIFLPSSIIETDDARVDVEYSTIAPKVSGNIEEIYIKDHQTVKKGQLLARIDARDYQAALAEAESNYAKAQADVSEAMLAVDRQPTVIRETEAQLRKVEAGIKLTKDNTARYEQLQALGAESRLITQQSKTTLTEQYADLDSSKEKVIDAQYQLNQYKIQVQAKQAVLKQAQAALDKAKLNLNYTEVRAPIDGMIGQKSANVGNFVSAGNPLMVVVPLDQVYVEANFREIELKQIKIGQPVNVFVDAYNVELKGVVDSFSPSTGAFFSPISATNATGNFTKIVQRLPLRIKLIENQKDVKLLRPGLSVLVSIDTNK